MLFEEIPGLPETKKKLLGAFQRNHLAHAIIFSGQKGSGALPLALAFATYLNCEDRTNDDACGKCSSCIKNKKFIHPDLAFAFPVSPVKNISGSDVISKSFLKEWRVYLHEFPFGDENTWSAFFGGENKQLNISREESRQIIRQLSLKPFEGQHKIMLIWLPEYMHNSAANALLKIIEEPAPNTVFLLVSNDPDKVLGTIRSRCQQMTVPPFRQNEIVDYLTSKMPEHEQEMLHQAANMAAGNMLEAEKWLQKEEDINHDYFRNWLRACYALDMLKLSQWADEFQKLSKNDQKAIFQYGLRVMEEVLYELHHADFHKESDAEAAFVSNFAKIIDLATLEKISIELNDSWYYLERNVSPKIMMMDLSLKVGRLLKQTRKK